MVDNIGQNNYDILNKNKNDTKRALNSSLRYLGYRARSTREVVVYLERKGYDEDIINDTIYKLKDYGYIDDVKFAASWVENRRKGKPMGRRLIEQELINKGIDKGISANAVSLISDQEEEETALRLVEKYLGEYKNKKTYVDKQKIYQRLVRRGFQTGIIRKVVENVYGTDE